MTDAQSRFADEYLIDLNATRAYKAAYPRVTKDSTAAQAGSRMLRNVKVENYINKRREKLQSKLEINQENILKELAAIAFCNGSDFAELVVNQSTDDSGKLLEYYDVKLKPTATLDEYKKKALSGIKYGKYGIEVSSYDKVRALELLGKHLGIFKDKLEVSGSVDAGLEKLNSILNQVGKDE
jgi:phage terminase small subunit